MLSSIPVFWRHATTVLAGTVAAQALPLLVAPLIARLCTPADLGAFTVWLGITSIASTVATLRLEAAMILDHDRREQRTCFEVVACCSTWFAVLLTLAAAFAHVGRLPQAQKMPWFGLITLGIGTWLVANNQALLAYATSYNAFAKIFLKPTSLQLNYLKKHQNFWRFSLLAGLLNIAAGRFPLFLIGAKYGLFAAGLYALTERVLGAGIAPYRFHPRSLQAAIRS